MRPTTQRWVRKRSIGSAPSTRSKRPPKVCRPLNVVDNDRRKQNRSPKRVNLGPKRSVDNFRNDRSWLAPSVTCWHAGALARAELLLSDSEPL